MDIPQSELDYYGTLNFMVRENLPLTLEMYAKAAGYSSIEEMLNDPPNLEENNVPPCLRHLIPAGQGNFSSPA